MSQEPDISHWDTPAHGDDPCDDITELEGWEQWLAHTGGS